MKSIITPYRPPGRRRCTVRYACVDGHLLLRGFQSTHLKEILSAEEYERMVCKYRDGKREVRMEGGFIVTCFLPEADSRG